MTAIAQRYDDITLQCLRLYKVIVSQVYYCLYLFTLLTSVMSVFATAFGLGLGFVKDLELSQQVLLKTNKKQPFKSPFGEPN